MGSKRIVRTLVGLVLMFSMFVSVKVEAASFRSNYIVEQARGNAPQVTAYITGNKISKSTKFTGTVAKTIQLAQSGDVKKFDTAEGVNYIVLIDNSGSVNENQLKYCKSNLVKFRKELKAKDQFTLFTIGTTKSQADKTNVLGRTAKGTEKNKTASDSKKINKIKFLEGKKSRTVLYRSINQVLAENASPSMRTVLLIITDGEDDSTGKDNSKTNTLNNIKVATIPVYGLLLNNASHKPNKDKMNFTIKQILNEDNCHGFYFDASDKKVSKKEVDNGFNKIKDIILNKTYVVNLMAPNNQKVDGKTDLLLTAQSDSASEALASRKIDYSLNQKDEQAPVVSDITKSKSNAITFKITDNSGTVVGADQASNYSLKTKTEDNSGKAWKLSNVNYNSIDGTVILTFSDDLFTDEYQLSVNNIADGSQEKNVINQDYSFSFAGLDKKGEAWKSFVKSYWWILLIILVVIIGVVALIIIKRKPGQIVEINPEDMLKADKKKIRLTITDRTGKIKNVDWDVEGSLFVGRSKICNIYFDDSRLSKQHFVISVTKIACYIEDLESTNGTFVNGVKITAQRMLVDGDVILAGKEKFVFHALEE